MAQSVDEKIVQLTLDNKQFNKASDETIDSLEKLKKSLEFEGAVDSFNRLEKEVKQVDFSPLNKSIDEVGKSFTILDTITDTIFRNITNRIIDTGANMLKSLSTDQIATGWEKYAEQTGAVQTIMAATAQQFSDTGEQMEVVNSQLEKLTWFTDETSHKFNDMVGGIGKFTANNIDLDTSVKAMEGIATWASLSGANTNEASRAIYNLAQAVSVGAVKLMDWRSIENANMGTTEFKQTVIETAEEMGTLIKVADGMWKTLSGKDVSIANFSENLSDQWFSADVLLQSLNRYGNFADRLNQFTEETGALTASLLNIIDDYTEGTLDMSEAMKITGMTAEELTPWLEELGSTENDLGRRAFKAAQETKTFQEAIDYVKEAVSSGWATSFKYIFGDYLEAKEWWSEIAETMYDAFVVGGEIRNTILSMWKDDGGREDFLNGIREIITNVMDLVNIVKDSWNEVWFGPDDEDNAQLRNMADTLLDVTHRFLEFAKSIKPTEETTENLQRLLTSVFSILKTGVNVIKAIGKGLSPIADLLNIISGTLLQFIATTAEGLAGSLGEFFNEDRLNNIAAALRLIASVISGVLQLGLITLLTVVEKIVEGVKSFFAQVHENGSGIRAVIQTLVDTVVDFFTAFSEGETIANKVADGILFIFGGLVAGIKAIIDTIVGLITGELTFGDIFSGKGGVTDAVNGFSKILDDLQIRDKIANIVSWVKDFCSELVAADGIIVNFVINITDAIKYLWDNLKGLLSQLTIQDIKDLLLIAVLWQFISSITMVNKSLNGAITNFGGIAKTFNDFIKELTGNNTLMDKLTMMFNKSKFLQMGIAVTLLVAALGKLNSLDYQKTQQSVAALGVTLGILLAAMNVLSKILAKFPKSESKLADGMRDSFDSLAKNLMFIGVASLTIAQALKVVNESFFSEAGNFDWKRYAIIVSGVTILMTALAGITKIMGSIDTKGVGNLVSIIAIAAGVRLIAESVKALSTIEDINKMFDACLGISAIILALGKAVDWMKKVDWKTALATVPIIISFSTAMITVTATLALASKAMTNEDVNKAVTMLLMEVISLAGGIVVLGRALKKVPPQTLLSIASAMTAFGVATAAIAGAMKLVSTIDISKSGGSLIALGLGFVELAAALGALGVVLQQTSPTVITSIGLAMVEMAGAVFILAGALQLIQGIQWDQIQAGVLTIGAIVAIFTALGAVVAIFDAQTFGLVSQAIINMSDAFLKFSIAIGILSAGIFALATASAVMATIIAAFQALADKLGIDLPVLINQGFDTLKLIIQNFLQMLRDLAPDFLLTMVALFSTIAVAIEMVKHPTATAMVGVIIALADTIAEHGQEFVDALIKIIDFINNAKDLFDALKELCNTIGEFIGGAIVEVIWGFFEGLFETIFEKLGIELDDDMVKFGERAQADYEKALGTLNDGNAYELAKVQAFQTMQKLIEGWNEGNVDLEDAAVESALLAMDSFTENASGAAKESAKDILKNITAGIEENHEGFKDSYGLIAKYGKEGVGEGFDPGTPFDWFKTMWSDEIMPMLAAGEISAEDGIRMIFGDAAAAGIAGWEGVMDGWNPFSKLVVGKSTKKSGTGNATDAAVDELRNEKFAMKKGEREIKEVYEEEGEESGKAWYDGLTNGIKKSGGSGGSAAKAAKDEAKTISDAFSDELDKINRESQVSDKLFQLWKAQNPGAKDYEITAKEIEYQSEKVAIATQKASISQQIYQQTLEKMGESAKETHEAYMQMLDDQIAMLEAQNKLDELKSNGVKDQTQAFRDMSAAFTEASKKSEKDGRSMIDFLTDCGFTMDRIMRSFADDAGYIIPQKIEDAGNDMVTITKEVTSGVFNTYVDSALDQIEQAKPALEQASMELPETIEKSIISYSEGLPNTIGPAAEVGIDAFTDVANEKMEVLSDTFGEMGANAGETSSESFANKFTDSLTINSEGMQETVKTEVGTLLNDSLTNYTFEDAQAGIDNFTNGFTKALGDGMVLNSEPILTAFIEIMTQLQTYFVEEGYLMWEEIGQLIDNSIITGINALAQQVIQTIIQLANDIYNNFCITLGIEDGEYSQKFYEAGLMIDEGVVQGIEAGKSSVINAAVQMAVAAYEAACAALGIRSPSTMMKDVGMYYDLGFAQGIDNYADVVERSVKGMTDSLVDNTNAGLMNATPNQVLSKLLAIPEDDLHMTMVIDVDASQLERNRSLLEKAYLPASDELRLTMTNTGKYADRFVNRGATGGTVDRTEQKERTYSDWYSRIGELIEKDMAVRKEYMEKMTVQLDDSKTQPTVNFTQNNYSPKEISRVETYRNTKRQLDTFARKFSYKQR